MAALPNLHLKVTSPVLAAARVGDACDLVNRLAGIFGGERILWGSDYPQTHDRPYAALVDLGRDACRGLPPPDQALFLGDNAVRLWPTLFTPPTAAS
jgi:L-fuconolactonase